MKIIVIGDGWAALGAAGFASQLGHEITWIKNTGARIAAPLLGLEGGADASPGADSWVSLAQAVGIEPGPLTSGCFVREFRNKSFRMPAWSQAPTPEMAAEVRKEIVAPIEAPLGSVFEARFEQPLSQVEESIRARVLSHPLVTRIEADPVAGFKIEDSKVTAVILGSGTEIACDHAIFADRWSALPGLGGLPKVIPFLRHRDAVGVLQATFEHGNGQGQGLATPIQEAIFAPLHKEAGEEETRHVWGYFSADGKRSTWSVVVDGSQSENNHEIGKKLRRMKQALDRVFTGDWLPEGKADFVSTVTSEHFRFEEAFLFATGDAVEEPAILPKIAGLQFLTDGYGPSLAVLQSARALEVRAENPSDAPQSRDEDEARS